MGIYDPKLAEALHLLHDSVTKYGTLGNRVDELAILVATREEQMSLNEWYGHEAAALKAGLDQSIIDVVKFGKEPTGLDAKDALIIRFGREWFREHHVSPDTFAKTVEAFGQRGTVELIGVSGGLRHGRNDAASSRPATARPSSVTSAEEVTTPKIITPRDPSPKTPVCAGESISPNPPLAQSKSPCPRAAPPPYPLPYALIPDRA